MWNEVAEGGGQARMTRGRNKTEEMWTADRWRAAVVVLTEAGAACRSLGRGACVGETEL